MAAALTITKGKKQIRTYGLTTGVIVIGRTASCDLRLDDPDVSRKHASIREENGGYYVSDAGSRNGVLVNGRRIQHETKLEKGDILEIGPFTLACDLETASGGATPDEAEPATRFVSAQDLQKEQPGKKFERKATPGRYRVTLSVLDGPLKDAAFEDWSGDLTIGRSLDNHVVLLDDAVTSYHARIYEKPDGYYIEDLGSHNGTFVQGVKVTTHKLGPAARIRIGVTTLQFRIVDPVKRRKLVLRGIAAALVVGVILLLAVFMQPDNQAAAMTESGKALFRNRDFEGAKKAYQSALAEDPNYKPARDALQEVKAYMEADVVLERALKATEEARMEDAVNIVETAIRIAPAYRYAAKIKERIKAISEAEVAFEAKNWADSARLYRTIAADYPESKLVSRRLAVASAELVAAESLSAAKNQVQRGQLELARKSLSGITTQSVCYTAAAQMQSAIDWLNGVNRQLEGDDALAIRQTFDQLEKGQDPLKALDLSPDELKERINLRLQAISKKLSVEATELVRTGKRAEGFKQYEKALVADPSNEEASKGVTTIRALVRNECSGYLREFKRCESLGQHDLAAESLKKILVAGIPGEDYYEYAKAQLAKMKP